MRCVISQLIELNKNKQKSSAVLLRYLRIKYKINISRGVLERRMAKLTPKSWKIAD